jgi:hypothetical protein
LNSVKNSLKESLVNTNLNKSSKEIIYKEQKDDKEKEKSINNQSDNSLIMQEIENIKRNDGRSETRTEMFRSIHDRLFWSNEKIYEVRDKFRRMKDTINTRTLDDFNILENAIKICNEEEVLKYLRDKNFKFFYETELKKRKTLELILNSNQLVLLNKVLEDPFYKFDMNYVYTYIKQNLHNRTIANNEGNVVLTSAIMNDLYNKKMVRFLAWFLAKVKYFENFRMLVDKHEEFEMIKVTYRHFETDNDIEMYASSPDISSNALCECLITNLEDLGMYNMLN